MNGNPPGFFEGTEMPTAGWWEALWPDPKGVLLSIGLVPQADVVDLCSGDGWFTLQIARVAPRVIAVDIDPVMLEVARHRLTEAGVANCTFAAGNAYEVARLAPGGFDLVFMANAFHGVPDRPRLARAVRDTVKPGGRFAIVNWHQRPREETVILGEPRGPRTGLRLSPPQTIAAVEAGGRARCRAVGAPPPHYGAGCFR